MGYRARRGSLRLGLFALTLGRAVPGPGQRLQLLEHLLRGHVRGLGGRAREGHDERNESDVE